MKIIYTFLFYALILLSPIISSSQSWANDPGGIYNIPAEEYNPTYYGYGSDGDIIYNKIDLRNGTTMEIVNNAALYDFLGNQVATAWSSAIGWNHETDFRDGGIIASSIAEIKVGNISYTMVYAWSVNTQDGGRRSGWMKLSDLSPANSIENILNDNKTVRMDILRGGGIDNASYEEYEIISAVLPDYAEEYYLDPDRDASYTAGKARYYYTRDDYISGLKNIPETGKQRYGVAHNNVPLDAKFYKDTGVDQVDVNIYPPSSSTAISHKLELVWGYVITSAGEKIYSWINERTLSATGVTVGGGNEFTPDPNKLYYIDNLAHDLRIASNGESETPYTTSRSTTGNEVLWKFVNNGNDYWHIQRAAGGSKPRLRSDESSNADMEDTASSGEKTYYSFPESTTDGTYYATLPDGPTGYQRLQINKSGDVKMVADTKTGTWVSFKFTEASESVSSDNNIAPLGTASQSSTGWRGAASRGIDNNTDGRYSEESVTHTANEANAWWQVQWDDTYKIDQITIYNRTDCCSDRLSNFTVYVLDNSGNTVFSKSYDKSPSSSLTIDISGGAIGRSVKVQLDNTNPLSLAEVKVNGEIEIVNNCETLHSDNFNAGYGIWNDGGGDAYRGDFSSLTPFTSDCVRLRDNDSGSNISTDVLDLSNLSEVNIDFQYYPISMESGEDFFLQVSTDGGNNYSVVQEWNSGTEFENDKLYTESVNIDASNLSATTVFRFRCDASANTDQVYLDNIAIESCGNGAISSANNSLELDARELDVDVKETISIKAFPNPTDGKLFVDLSGYMNNEVDMYLIDLSGKIQMSKKLKIDHEQVVDLDLSVFQNGLYLLYIKGENRPTVSKKISLFHGN